MDRRPLVVCGPDGRPVAVLEENEKGYRKSIEQRHLWALHPGTGRLLPFYEAATVEIRERGEWYEATLSAVPTRPEPERPVQGSGAAAGSDAGSGGGAAVPDLGRTLTDLAALIARRHAELPEGSYTTHLFSSGPEKIRKKAGEEAIELLLAATHETIVSESADLIYHLLVLLESEGVTIEEVAAELARR